MKKIKLTQGKFALVDDEDFEYLNQFKWFAIKDKNVWYAKKGIYISEDQSMRSIQMGRFLLNPNKKEIIDHINGNGLDNRRKNLRIVNKSQNSQNRRINRDKKFKGITKRKDRKNKPFYASITFNKKTISLGYFASEIEAAKAYNEAAIKYFGEFARLNKI